MVRLEVGPLVTSARGALGDVTFRVLNGRQIAQRRSQPTGRPSPEQLTYRRRFGRCMEVWRRLNTVNPRFVELLKEGARQERQTVLQAFTSTLMQIYALPAGAPGTHVYMPDLAFPWTYQVDSSNLVTDFERVMGAWTGQQGLTWFAGRTYPVVPRSNNIVFVIREDSESVLPGDVTVAFTRESYFEARPATLRNWRATCIWQWTNVGNGAIGKMLVFQSVPPAN